MTHTPDYTPDYLTALASEYSRYKLDIARLEDLVHGIEATMRDALAAGALTSGDQFGRSIITIRPGNARLNNTKLANAFPVTEHPELYKPTIDTKAVRAHIAKVDLVDYETRGDDIVTIKPAD